MKDPVLFAELLHRVIVVMLLIAILIRVYRDER